MSAAPLIRGWCPGGRRPMMSGDGLVVRVRPWHGTLSAAQAQAVADLAERHGNGRIEITSRANLQLRGVTEAHLPALTEGLAALSLLDDTAEAEARRNVVLHPFHEETRWNTRALGAGLYAGLAQSRFAGLPGKFGFAVDPGPVRWLEGISGDIRIEASGDRLLVRADGSATGRLAMSEGEAVACALSLAEWFLASGGVGADGRGRMRTHLPSAILPATLRGDARPSPSRPFPGPGQGAGGTLIAAAFGQLTPDALRAVADAAGSEVRLTPARMVYLPGARLSAPPHPDLIVDAGDPLLRVMACTGAPDCPQAEAETRQIARRLAAGLPPGRTLHVSGCAKGCAHPKRAEVTLVGRAGRFDLVRNGTPWDQPDRTSLSLADLPALIET